jgi:glucokinase
MQIIPDGPTCGCGQRGHLEALATGPAIALRMAGLLRSGLSSHLQAAGETVTPEQIVAAAQKGDALSIQVLEEAGSFIGMAVANLVHIFAPQRFVIGGGVANGAGDLLLEPVRRTAHERLMRGYHDTYDIVPPALGDDSGLLGAAAYAFQQFRNTFSTTS